MLLLLLLSQVLIVRMHSKNYAMTWDTNCNRFFIPDNAYNTHLSFINLWHKSCTFPNTQVPYDVFFFWLNNGDIWPPYLLNM